MASRPRRTRNLTRTVLAVLCVAAVTGVAACGTAPKSDADKPKDVAGTIGGSLDSLVAAAKKEGTLTLYSGDAQDTLNIEAAEFKSKYGIDVKIVRALTDPLDARIASEYKSGVHNADVYQAGSTEPFLAQNKDYFLPLSASNVPGWDDYPAAARQQNSYVYLRENPTVIQYNTTLVPKDKVPTSWQDLLDPFWKGHLQLTDLTSSGSYMQWAEIMKQQYGISYLQKLKAQGLKIAASGTAAAQDIAAGSAYADFPGRIVHSVTLRKEKAPIAYQVMPGSGVPIFAAVFAKAPHPYASLLFVDYLMSVEGQKDMCAKVEGTLSFYNIDGKSPDQQIEGCLPPEKGWQLNPFNVTDESERNALLTAIGQK
ncbi:ABC transporter substrate-binding protein [Actinacidiphila epipremni]|uniref:Extracellular solute-binding protein n=1 Tax=Actinacidiphila epipremni TaxID=2053013 RepID=A0ABX0ZPQ4_9ACTN|nr:extracellular solute-binding protein [Actinacidiphila epipremni]NJP44636.1 extracellular solute-binding protein [Actinacidiphila epipremni]